MFIDKNFLKMLLICNLRLHPLRYLYAANLSYARYIEYATVLQLIRGKMRNAITRGYFFLDIGCGKSILPYMIKEVARGEMITVDINKNYLKFQKKFGITCVLASAPFLPFLQNSIDYLTSISVLEHIPDGLDFTSAEEIGRVTRNMAIISVPFSKVSLCIIDEFYGIPNFLKKSEIIKNIIRALFSRLDISREGFIQRVYDVKKISDLISHTGLKPTKIYLWGGRIPEIVYKVIPIGLLTILEYFIALTLKRGYEDFIIVVLEKPEAHMGWNTPKSTEKMLDYPSSTLDK